MRTTDFYRYLKPEVLRKLRERQAENIRQGFKTQLTPGNIPPTKKKEKKKWYNSSELI